MEFDSDITGIVILNYNNVSDTINCIKSLYDKIDSSNFKLIVVDNCSEISKFNSVNNFLYENYNCESINETDELINELPQLLHLRLSKNYGYAIGNNKGAKLFFNDSNIKYILILNNDIVLIEDIINPLVRFEKENKNVGIVSPLLLKNDGTSIDQNCARKNKTKSQIFIQYLLLGMNLFNIQNIIRNKNLILLSETNHQKMRSIEIELPSGSCMLLKKDVFMKIAGFDEHTFLFWEENILYKKVSQIGLKNFILPNLKCIHLGSATTKSVNTDRFLHKCEFDSMIYYLKKYTNVSLFYIVLINALNIITDLRIRVKEYILK